VTGAVARIGDYLRALSGWRLLLASILAGAIYALGFAPLEIFPAMLLGLAAFVLLLDGAAARPRPIRWAAAIGWGFGFGQFVTGMHWIFYPFLVDPIAHAWLIPFVAILFPGVLALFTALASAAAMYVWRDGWPRIFILGACYAACEWLRGHVLTGLPWNLPAYGWGASLAILESAALYGAYGLSLLTVLFGFSLAELFGRRPRPSLPLAATALFAALWIGGTIRLATTPQTFVAGVQLRLVQPDIPQDEKYVRRLVRRNWQRLIALSTGPGSPNVIIWPEAAPPVLLQRSPEALEQIAALTNLHRTLITGNQREAFDAKGDLRFFNSLYVFAPGGILAGTYDKFHLVPFGEYLPAESLLAGLGITKLVGFPGSFSSGDGPHTMQIPGVPPASPLICYEILFPSAVVSGSEPRPGWLLNITDDSWFGPWAGPRQHLLAARVRAIEEGLPLVRAANTGISAVIDSQGRTVAELGLNRMGSLDSRLPDASPATPYARFGDLLFFVLLVLSATLPLAHSRK
jgi:apolipoprotein N-acyltransferase